MGKQSKELVIANFPNTLNSLRLNMLGTIKTASEINALLVGNPDATTKAALKTNLGTVSVTTAELAALVSASGLFEGFFYKETTLGILLQATSVNTYRRADDSAYVAGWKSNFYDAKFGVTESGLSLLN